MRFLRKYGLLWLLSVMTAILLVPHPFRADEKITWYQDQVAVIAYHHIDDQLHGDVTITKALFRSQLTDLLQRGYHFISLQQFRDFMTGAPVPPNAVLVTFDDGYESFYTEAYPVLQQLSIPAVNFVITQDLEYPGHSHIRSLTRDQIREMVHRSPPQVDVQCHSDSLHQKTPGGHALLVSRLSRDGTEESQQQFSERITEDTLRCRKRLTELSGQEVDSYAYPFGIFDEGTVQLLHQAGIRYGFTTTSGLTERGTDLMHIPRINAGSPFVRSNSLNNLILKHCKHH